MRSVLIVGLILAIGIAAMAATDFNLPALRGGTVRLSGLERQGPVLLMFFKTWCGVSKTTMEKMQPFVEYAKAAPQFHFIAIGENTTAEVKAYDDDETVHPTIVIEPPPFKIARAMSAHQTPTLVLLDSSGHVLTRFGGWNRKAMNQLSQKVATLLHQPYREISNPSDGLPDEQPGCVLIDTPPLLPGK